MESVFIENQGKGNKVLYIANEETRAVVWVTAGARPLRFRVQAIVLASLP